MTAATKPDIAEDRDLSRAEQDRLRRYCQQLEQSNAGYEKTIQAQSERQKKAREALVASGRFKPEELGGDLADHIKTLTEPPKDASVGATLERAADFNRRNSGVDDHPTMQESGLGRQLRQSIDSHARGGGPECFQPVGTDGNVLVLVANPAQVERMADLYREHGDVKTEEAKAPADATQDQGQAGEYDAVQSTTKKHRNR